MDENKFWINIWSIVALCFIILIMGITIIIIGITTYNINSTNKIHDLISKGVDPISAKCAVSPSNLDVSICTIVAMKK